MLFPNTPDFTVLWLALARIGAVAVPISTLSTAAELRRVAQHADLHLIAAVGKYLNHDYVARIAEAFPGIAEQGPALELEVAPHLRAVWLWADEVPKWAVDGRSERLRAVAAPVLAAAE